MLRQLCFLTIAAIAVLLPQEVKAARSYTFAVKLADGPEIKVKSTVYRNDRGVNEMYLQSADMAKVTIGYGRDLDGNGTIETFFLIGDEGMTTYTRTTKGENSWGHARSVVARHASYSAKKYYKTLLANVGSFLLMSVSSVVEAKENYFKEWTDLEELRIMLERKKSTLSKETYLFGVSVLLDGHKFAYEKLQRGLGKNAAAWAAADAGLYLSGAVLLRFGGKAVSVVGRRYAPEAKKIATRAALAAGVRMTLKTYQLNIRAALRGLTARTALKGAQNLLIKGAKGVQAEWKYIALSSSIQVGVETYVNYDEFKDPDPKVVANRLLKSNEVKENVLINLTDTLVMTGVNAAVKNRIARYALLGTVGAGSSVVVGNALNGDQSGARVALDTGWSFGVDTTSLILEIKALHKFESLALKKKNPRLKLIGYGIVLVSNAVGYVAYSKAVKYVDPQKDLKDGQIVFVPIIASN